MKPKNKSSKTSRRIRLAFIIIVLVVAAVLTLLNLPWVQQRAAVALASALERRTGAQVGVGNVRLRLPADLMVDSLCLDDLDGQPLIAADRLAVKIDWRTMIGKGEIAIRNVRLFNPMVAIRTDSAGATPNYQFLVDAFTPADTTAAKKPIPPIRVNSLIVRGAHITYDVADEPTTAGQLNPSHLDVDDLNLHLSLKTLQEDTLSVIMRQLSLREASGLDVDDLTFRLVANRRGAALAGFNLRMPSSQLRLDSLFADFGGGDGVRFRGVVPSSTLAPADMAALVPAWQGSGARLIVGTRFKGSTDGRFDVPQLTLRLNRRDVDIIASGQGSTTAADYRLARCSVSPSGWTTLATLLGGIDNRFGTELRPLCESLGSRLGATSLQGTAALRPEGAMANIALKADTGEADVDASLRNGHLQAVVDTRSLALGRLTGSSELGDMSASLNLSASLPKETPKDGKWLEAMGHAALDGTVSSIAYKGYSYQPIHVAATLDDGKARASLDVNDPNIRTHLTAQYDVMGGKNACQLQARVDDLNLHSLGLTEKHETSRFSFRLGGNVTGRSLDDLRGTLALDSLQLTDADHTWKMNRLRLNSFPNGGQKCYTIDSDFMDMKVLGYFSPENLVGSLYNLLMDYEPTLLATLLPQGMKAARKADKAAQEGRANVLSFDVTVRDLSLLDELFFIPVRAAYPLKVKGGLYEDRNTLDLTVDVPHLRYGDNQFRNMTLNVTNANRPTLRIQAGGEKVESGGNTLMADVAAEMSYDDIRLDAEWKGPGEGVFDGNLHAKAAFSKNENGGLVTSLTGQPSSAVVGHETWTLAPFTASLSKDAYSVAGLRLTSGTQYLAVDGTVAVPSAQASRAGTASDDSLSVRLNQVDVAPFLSMVNLEGITFGGIVSGNAGVEGLLTKAPRLEARLDIDSLTFCDAVLGDARADVGYNDNGILFDIATPTTRIDGTAGLEEGTLDLTVTADSTDLRFLDALLTDIMSDVSGSGQGRLHIYGPFTALALEGRLRAVGASFTLVPTGVKYEFDDYINFEAGERGAISFDGVKIYDTAYNPQLTHRSAYAPGVSPHTAVLDGAITHNHLTDWAYDLTIRTNNVLALNLRNTGTDAFWATIVADGMVHVSGSEAENALRVDVDAETRPGSSFALNLGNTAQADADFIRFRDRDTLRTVTFPVRPLQPRSGTDTPPARRGMGGRRSQAVQPDVDINVRARVTPDATIRLVTDAVSDDAISAYGEGTLDIHLHNEDDIGLYGTYTLQHGEYRLSIQDLVTKRFEVADGSTVVFDGDPLEARLDIKALHTVNSVSLADLSADASAMGSVRVNCVIDISGTPNAPQLDFGIELPQATEEQRTLLRSYTATDEQTNLQFVYLLGLGRFYTYDYSQASTQGTQGGVAAMQSLLTSTVAGQLNALVANLLPSDNWSLSSSIKSDNLLGAADDELTAGNMEVQGALEGRLLNNRLLVNGNFGYRDNPMYASNFIGDFDIRYLLLPRSNLWLKGYNRTNDRYFSKTALTTQGIGLMFNRDFDFFKSKTQTP